MIAFREWFEGWEISTLDKELDDLIITEYSGRLFEYQHESKKIIGRKLFKFKELDESPLLELLSKYGLCFRYNLRCKSAGICLSIGPGGF